MKYAFIDKFKEKFSIKLMCKILGVSRSGYQNWRKIPSPNAVQKFNLIRTIEKIFIGSRNTYGSPRIYAQLKGMGFKVSKSTVERIMRQYGLKAKKRRKFKPTTDSNHSRPIAPNLLDRQFNQKQPNKVWLSDITYISTSQGWLYLATVMDMCTRKIVGWKLDNRMTANLVSESLKAALGSEYPQPGLILHSDRGSQYASKQYLQLIWKNKLIQSMSRKGNCWDNAPMESFFDTLKSEFVHHQIFKSKDEAKSKIFEWIEVFYNRQRIHSSLGYKSPTCFFDMIMREEKVA